MAHRSTEFGLGNFGYGMKNDASCNREGKHSYMTYVSSNFHL